MRRRFPERRSRCTSWELAISQRDSFARARWPRASGVRSITFLPWCMHEVAAVGNRCYTHVPLPSTPQVADTHTLPMNIWIEPRNVGGRVLLGPPVVIRYRRETIRVPVSSLGANITANVSRCPCYYVLHFVSRWEGSDSERCDKPVWIISFLFAREVCDESWW